MKRLLVLIACLGLIGFVVFSTPLMVSATETETHPKFLGKFWLDMPEDVALENLKEVCSGFERTHIVKYAYEEKSGTVTEYRGKKLQMHAASDYLANKIYSCAFKRDTIVRLLTIEVSKNGTVTGIVCNFEFFQAILDEKHPGNAIIGELKRMNLDYEDKETSIPYDGRAKTVRVIQNTWFNDRKSIFRVYYWGFPGNFEFRNIEYYHIDHDATRKMIEGMSKTK